MDSQTLQGEPFGKFSDKSSKGSIETDFIKVPGADGTNFPRYISIENNTSEEFFTIPLGKVYGFVDKEGNIYLDETVICPEHPIHFTNKNKTFENRQVLSPKEILSSLKTEAHHNLRLTRSISYDQHLP